MDGDAGADLSGRDASPGASPPACSKASGLPELVCRSLEDYERMALRLAREPAALAEIKARLEANRTSARLFDTPRLVRDIEAAYATMWEIHQRDEPPHSFAVSPPA